VSHGTRMTNLGAAATAAASDQTYVDGAPLDQAWWRAMDTAQSKSLDADYGGTWNPSNPIVIGGAGMWWCGQVALNGGSSLQTPLGSGVRIVHADNDTPLLKAGHTGATRTIITDCAISANAGVDVSTAATRKVVPLRVHGNATFAQATFKLSGSTVPWLRVYALSIYGDLTSLGATTNAGILPGGWYVPAGAGTSFTYTILPALTILRATHLYMAEILTAPGFVGTSVACKFTGIPDMRPQ
jgi:hypothetical protein